MKVMGKNPSNFKKGGSYPVESVSWGDVQKFLKKLNYRSGFKFRLPTECEWEYAARNGGTEDGYSEISSLQNVAWYRGNSSGKSHPVGEKRANKFGLYDVLGNVREWCSDCYYSDYYRESPLNNPKGPLNFPKRVLRGGGWKSGESRLRVTYRENEWPEYEREHISPLGAKEYVVIAVSRHRDLGFRLVRDGIKTSTQVPTVGAKAAIFPIMAFDENPHFNATFCNVLKALEKENIGFNVALSFYDKKFVSGDIVHPDSSTKKQLSRRSWKKSSMFSTLQPDADYIVEFCEKNSLDIALLCTYEDPERELSHRSTVGNIHGASLGWSRVYLVDIATKKTFKVNGEVAFYNQNGYNDILELTRKVFKHWRKAPNVRQD